MKKALFLIAVFIPVTIQLSAQKLTDSLQSQLKVESQNIYLQRAKQQRTTGTVLLAGGLTLGSIGLLISISQLGDMLSERKHSYSNAGDVLNLLGGVLTVTSIPFYIASSENKKKAKLVLGNSSTAVTPDFRFQQTTIGLSIALGR